MRLPVRLTSAAFLAGCATALASCIPGSGSVDNPVEPIGAGRSIPTGPAADYPVVVGEPFTIDGVIYTPADTLNYDEVGYATMDEGDATGVTGAHRTLPLPSYVEVTALDSGRTALVRVERRGPMVNSRLLALSTDALVQLGLSEGNPVRVRRVNPPEDERAELRADRQVPLRMETPPGLLEVLKRNLPAIGSASLARAGDTGGLPDAGIRTVDPDTETPRQIASQQPVASAIPAPRPSPVPSATPVPEASPAPRPSPTPVASPPPASKPAAKGDFAVQVGAYSTRAAAQRVADSVGGYVEPAGSLFRARAGPFVSRGQAADALAKARDAGYKGALIVSLK